MAPWTMRIPHSAEGIVQVCHRLAHKGLLAAGDGNVSLRREDGRILMTPRGMNKAFLQAEDMALLTLEGTILSGNPSSERLMHLAIYRTCPEARVVVHAHPPSAIAWTVARPDSKDLPVGAISEVIIGAGRIPVAPYARPGSEAMGEVLKPFLPGCRAIILARHGGLAWGEDLEEALNGLERIEHSAQVLVTAHSLGGITELPADEVEALKKIRAAIGPRLL